MSNLYFIQEAVSDEDITDAFNLFMLGSEYKTNEMNFSMFAELQMNRALGGKFFVIANGDYFVGAATTSPKQIAGTVFDVVRIHRLAIHPLFRRKGLARDLVDHVCHIYKEVDAASESEAGFKMLRSCMPYKRKLKGGLTEYGKAEGFHPKYSWVFSSFEPDDNKCHCSGIIKSDQAAEVVWLQYKEYINFCKSNLTKDEIANNTWGIR